jgi:N-acetyl-anhydromuramyl-L-alanine amidase AmpD
MARYIQHIVIHCSATKEGKNVTEADIERWHAARFRRIGGKHTGYHILVYTDGTVVYTKGLQHIGQHVAGKNANSIGVCYIGGLDKSGNPKDTRTPEQKKALVRLLKYLRKDYPHAEILGHRDFSPDTNRNGLIEPWEYLKACPCFNAKEEYKAI